MKNVSKEPRTAVALQYTPDSGDKAPRIVASGKGFIAEQIMQVAKEHGVTLREDPALVSALAELEVGSTVPPELFRAVAEVLAFVYKMNGKMPRKK